MRNLIMPICLIASSALLSADTLYLRDGRVLNGTFVSGTSRQVRFHVEGNRQAQLFPVRNITSLQFGSNATTGSNYGSSSNSGTWSNNQNNRTYSSSSTGSSTYGNQSRARSASATVPEGTVVTVRTIDPINSDRSNIGDTFRASLDDPLIVNGRTIAPQGADVVLRVAAVDQQSGISGSEEISLELHQIRVNNRTYNVRSSGAEVSAKNRNSESVKVIGGTAVLGAVIGAIAGGGKGAAIGAAAGAGTGAAIQAIRGQRVQIPAESQLDFRLSEPIYLD